MSTTPTVPTLDRWMAGIQRSIRDLQAAPNAYRPIITDAQTRADQAAQDATAAQQTASDAATTAQAASDTASAANDTAVQAQQAATAAAGDASTALTNANDAKTLATGANTTSQTALDTANGAASDASTALSTANDASAAATQASNDAAAAQSTATAAQTAASQAQSDASAAIDAAGDAQSAAAAAASAASTAQSTANSKIRTYIQGTAPSSGMTTGDIWFDSSNGNRPSRWSGSAWVLAQDGSIATAQSAAEAAATAASDAQDAATAAQSTATAAQTAAGQAQTAADNAQDAADSAATAAADAAGLAGSKSVVYIQSTAPAGDPLNLWIDTTGGANTPKRWNGSAWVAVTDKAATDAASAAAAAQSAAEDAASAASAAQGTADAAQSAASAAQTTANSAQSLAASKTTTFRQAAAPSTSGRVVGDLWYDTDNGNALSIWSGSAWVAPYSHTPDGAYDLASTASSAAATAQSAAAAAQSAADDAQSAATAAQSTADSAQTDATSAGNAAAAAQSTADAANSAASSAQSTADAAQTAANTAQAAASSAQTTADGKNTIFRQTTAPSTTGRTAGDLWFDTDDGNRPYVFASGAWTTARDTTIATAQSTADSAASAASAAQSDADAAASAASAAQGTANSALTAANGKNKVTYSTNAPSGTGTVGDLWFQVDGTGAVTGQWQWTGSAWQSRQVTNSVISNLDAGKITTGTINAARLNAADIQAKMLAAGKVTASSLLVAGSVTSASGVIGALDAGAITTGTLAADRIATGSLDGAKITAGTITSGQLAADSVVAGKIAAGAVTAGTIAAGAVTAGSIAAGAIATGDLAAGAVTAAKMATGTITAASGIIASIDASKITTGTLTGIVVQGSTIQTAATGRRVVLGPSAAFDTSPAVQFYADDGDRVGSLTGRIITGGFRVMQLAGENAAGGQLSVIHLSQNILASVGTSSVDVATDGVSISAPSALNLGDSSAALRGPVHLYGTSVKFTLYDGSESDSGTAGSFVVNATKVETHSQGQVSIWAETTGRLQGGVWGAGSPVDALTWNGTQVSIPTMLRMSGASNGTIVSDTSLLLKGTLGVLYASDGLPTPTYFERVKVDQNGGVYISKALIIRSDGGSETDHTISRAGTVLSIDNNAQNTIGIERTVGRLKISGTDVFTWDGAGTYAYGTLFLRTVGGSQTDAYLQRTGNNIDLTASNGAFRINGALGAILEVTAPGGSAGIRSATIYGRTTGSGANVFVASDGTLARSTSSAKYKTKVQDLTLEHARRLLDLRPVTYQSLCLDDDKRRRLVGLIAEEVHAAGVTPLVSYAAPGEPDGIAYERAVPYLILLLRDAFARIDALEAA